ncbi:MAG: bifunctional riboflavin kinase/FAD synthetase [Gammaproteobacteria bacterium]|nr:bifunctional riboflavin kinase/FAD synthetase [Gammaproteobacteria bacterium]
MEFFRGLHSLPPAAESGPGPCVATIGNFDGVHRGHLQVVRALKKEGERQELPVVVVVFEPTPQEFFAGDRSPARLTRFGEKYHLLEKAGVDKLICLRFDSELSAMGPGKFVQRLLIDGMQLKHLVVGDDFRFGKDRAGDFKFLVAAGEQAGFAVEKTDSFVLDSVRVSSSGIRQALKQGDLAQAERWLGRPYGMKGRVIEGEKLGRKLGFPTANIHPRRTVCPVHGIYAVRVNGAGLAQWPGVASIGSRPTVTDGEEIVLEVHLFGFSGNLYGESLEVLWLHKLREEKHFASLEALTEEMKNDADLARKLLGIDKEYAGN